MRILQINDDVKKEIKKVKEYANQHIVTGDMLKLIKYGDLRPVGDNPDHLVHIHDGYRVIYSVDQNPETKNLYHHLSISIGKKLKYPHECAVDEIAKEFGMKGIKDA